MRHDLISGVEEILGRKVVVFMSDNHIDADVAVEVFVLAPLVRSRRATTRAASPRPHAKQWPALSSDPAPAPPPRTTRTHRPQARLMREAQSRSRFVCSGRMRLEPEVVFGQRARRAPGVNYSG